jgi:hypothetical protein
MNEKRLKQIIRESIKKVLIGENKTVTFNGKINPPYGWAVIMCGGPGVGKTTATKMHIPIQGKVVSSDYFKEAYADMVNLENSPNYSGKKTFSKYDPYVNGELDIPKENDGVIWDLRNSRQAAQINRTEKNVGLYDKQINNFLKSNNNPNYLPNLIFETAGSKKNIITKIFDFLSKIGNYKVSLVWVVANRKVAYASMLGRDRLVPDDAFHDAHNGIYREKGSGDNTTAPEILKKYSNNIDEAWIIVNSSYDVYDDGTRIDRRPNEEENKSNVIKLEKVNGRFVIPEYFGTDEKKPFLGGKQNVSMEDIVGQRVRRMGRKNPVDDEDLSSDVFPTSKNAMERAKNDANSYPLKNVKVPFRQSDVDNRINQGKERLNKGKRQNNHISLI